jgi:hypothetical protein
MSLCSDVADELRPASRPALVALHDHIEQHHREVVVRGQHPPGLGAAVRVQEFQTAVLEAQATQDQPGDLMDGRLIVDDQDLPDECLFLVRFVEQQQRAVVVVVVGGAHRKLLDTPVDRRGSGLMHTLHPTRREFKPAAPGYD